VIAPHEIDALKRYWVKKREWWPVSAKADWSRVMARRPKVLGPRGVKSLRILGKHGWSWGNKRAYFLARQVHVCRKFRLSSLRQRHIQRKNKPIH